jgi:hypothetical protein
VLRSLQSATGVPQAPHALERTERTERSPHRPGRGPRGAQELRAGAHELRREGAGRLSEVPGSPFFLAALTVNARALVP